MRLPDFGDELFARREFEVAGLGGRNDDLCELLVVCGWE
jgi:hypothetical protein